MLSIANDYRNVNQNHNEGPPHMGQNGQHQKVYKQLTLERMWREENPAILWVGM